MRAYMAVCAVGQRHRDKDQFRIKEEWLEVVYRPRVPNAGVFRSLRSKPLTLDSQVVSPPCLMRIKVFKCTSSNLANLSYQVQPYGELLSLRYRPRYERSLFIIGYPSEHPDQAVMMKGVFLIHHIYTINKASLLH